jgi:hypothetical protein
MPTNPDDLPPDLMSFLSLIFGLMGLLVKVQSIPEIASNTEIAKWNQPPLFNQAMAVDSISLRSRGVLGRSMHARIRWKKQ